MASILQPSHTEVIFAAEIGRLLLSLLFRQRPPVDQSLGRLQAGGYMALIGIGEEWQERVGSQLKAGA